MIAIDRNSDVAPRASDLGVGTAPEIPGAP